MLILYEQLKLKLTFHEFHWKTFFFSKIKKCKTAMNYFILTICTWVLYIKKNNFTDFLSSKIVDKKNMIICLSKLIESKARSKMNINLLINSQTVLSLQNEAAQNERERKNNLKRTKYYLIEMSNHIVWQTIIHNVCLFIFFLFFRFSFSFHVCVPQKSCATFSSISSYSMSNDDDHCDEKC